MATTVIQTPYSTAMPFVQSTTAIGWLDEYDAQRLASYDLYDDLYNNDPTQYKMMLRGQDEQPIYVPVAKRIINALSRYVGKDWGYLVVSSDGTDAEQQAAKDAFSTLFKRERILSQFTSGKKEWLRRGDWIWYISADETKREGTRITVKCMDPRLYFPIFESDDVQGGDPDRITGARLVEEILLPDGKTPAIKSQRWIKQSHPDHPSYGQATEPATGWDIYYDVTIFEMATYGDSDATKRKILDQPTKLTELIGITALPLYHIKNNENTGDPYGRSDLSGVESILSGINQSTSDEDLTLALMGIGQYWTDSGAPVNEQTGQIENWKLGPNRVVEVDEGTTFDKVDGATSIQPFQDHLNFLQGQAYGINGLSDVSIGTTSTDTHVSQLSGIALAIHMQPVFDMADEKDDQINTVMTQMFHDLKEWLNVYEGINLGDTTIISVMDESKRLPFDRDSAFNELMQLVTAGIVTPKLAVQMLQDKFGYEFPDGYAEEVVANMAAKAAAADPFAARSAQERTNPQSPAGSPATAQTPPPPAQTPGA